jgi:Domain of unknown function (DUF4266)
MKLMFRLCWTSRRVERIALLVSLCTLAAGCASIGPKPWQHDLMAQPAMRVDAYALQSAVDDHIYFSKEASSGGRSFAGGGCGCN